MPNSISSFNIESVLHQLKSNGQISNSLKQELKDAQNKYADHSERINLGSIGEINVPQIDMGSINSSHLLGLDEIIIFAFYLSRRGHGKKALDLGANIGLHSLVLAKLGFKVTAYEPDPIHIIGFQKLMKENDLLKSNLIDLRERAVTVDGGEVEFVHVHDNSTSSHVLGSLGKNPYGPTSILEVNSDALKEVLDANQYQLVKMDVEGLESTLLISLSEKHFQKTEMVLEIGSEEAAKMIWDFFSKSNFKIFIYSQKIAWRKAREFSDLPNSYKQGSVIISYRENSIF